MHLATEKSELESQLEIAREELLVSAVHVV